MEKAQVSGRWAVTSWLLTCTFFGVSFVYGMHGSVIGWIIWSILWLIWLRIATQSTAQYLKNRNSNQC